MRCLFASEELTCQIISQKLPPIGNASTSTTTKSCTIGLTGSAFHPEELKRAVRVEAGVMADDVARALGKLWLLNIRTPPDDVA